MEDPRNDDKQNEPSSRSVFRGSNIGIAFFILAITAAVIFLTQGPKRSKITYSFLIQQLRGVDSEGKPIEDEEGEPVLDDDGEPICNIEYILINDSVVEAQGRFRIAPKEGPRISRNSELLEGRNRRLEKNFVVNLPAPDSKDRQVLNDLIENATSTGQLERAYASPDNSLTYIYIILSVFIVGIVLMMWISYRRSQNQMMGGGGFLSGFSKSPAKRYEASNQPITFADVAGLEGVKADLQEIVDYLTDPGKFQRLGGRVPKGVLLNGPPGTGKTLLARAIAGEASVPYYSVNGSEFIQMFVGVGASRVRDLFKTAKDTAPSIIFIDEIDAVGRQRGAGLGGGHDEREQTLNQILSEMDGFMGGDSVIVVAATNRPDVLDPALLRPGRFDRHITVNRPTQKGRVAIFKVHVRDVPLGSDVNLDVLAAGAVGLTGADIRNLVNEAALWAARQNKTKVEMEDFEYARDKVLMGAKREEVLTDADKEKTAYHEAGHTLAAWFLKGAYPVHKVTIIPRGQALGVTHMVPGEDRINMSESEIRDQLVVLLAGRAAEKIVYSEVTVGAENDLERATGIARRMITSWGMSQRLGPVSFKLTDEDPFLGREIQQNRHFSEHTLEVIDEEVTKLLTDAAANAEALLNERREQLDALTEVLVKDEELGQAEIESVIGPSVHPPTTPTPIDSNTQPVIVDSETTSATSTSTPADTPLESKAEDSDAQTSEASPASSPREENDSES